MGRRVLVAFEESDVVGKAFRDQGHHVTSCDLLPSRGSPDHVQGDVRPLLREPWDLVIAHPPCTFLTPARGKLRDMPETLAAIELFQECQHANAPMVAVENPLPYVWVRQFIGEPDCLVQPWQFGDMYLKRTGWWLDGFTPVAPNDGRR